MASEKKIKKNTKTRERTAQGRNPEREAELLEAYLKVAMAEGVENVTLQKIASQASVAYSTVHYYLGTGDIRLVDRVSTYVRAASTAFMESQLNSALVAPDRNAIDVYIEAKLEWGKKFPTYASMLCYSIYQSSRDPEARTLSLALNKSSLQRIQTLLLQEIGKGHYPPLRDFELLATKLVTVINGAVIAAAISPPGEKDSSFKKMVRSMVGELISSHKQKVSSS